MKTKTMAGLALVTLLLAGSAPLAQQATGANDAAARIERFKAAVVDGGPGHGEGHNSGQAVNIVAALAVKEWMEREKIAGTLLIWPGVAEELVGGKAHMVRAGIFRGVDAVLFTHVGNEMATTWGQPNGTGMMSVEYT